MNLHPPLLNRIPHFDERSRSHGIMERLQTPSALRPREWGLPEARVDQGQEGHCVGFGWGNELALSPVRVRGVGNDFCHGLFYGAQHVDRREGRYFRDGATVLAGAKHVRAQGFMEEYRWAFGTEEVLHALVDEGPVVLGVDWTDGMYDTRPSGLVDVSGNIVGGHCITLYGYHPRMRISGEGWFKRYEVVRWINSWGPTYGKNGTGLLRVEDLDWLLRRDGEACVPVHRKKGFASS